jgi:hypothetical protein
MPPNFPRDEDFFAQIVEVPNKYSKYSSSCKRTNASFDVVQTNARWQHHGKNLDTYN